MKKYWLMCLSILFSGMLFSQAEVDGRGPNIPLPDIRDFESKQEMLDFIFGDLSRSKIPSGILINRSGSTLIPKYDGTSKFDLLTMEKWLVLKEHLSYSEMDFEADLELSSDGNYPSLASHEVNELANLIISKYWLDHASTKKMSIPIGIIDMNYERFTSSALTLNSAIKLEGGRYKDIPNSTYNPYVSGRCFAATALIDELWNDEIQFYVDEELYFSNHDEEIDHFQIDFGDGKGFIKLEWGDKYVPKYTQSGFKTLQIKCIYKDDKVLFSRGFVSYNQVKIEDPEIKKKKDLAIAHMKIMGIEYTTFDLKVASNRSFRGRTLSAMTEVNHFRSRYRKGGNFQKPVFLVTGYDPMSSSKMGYEYFSAYNKSQLLTSLIEKGYDVIIVRYPYSTDYIQTLAALLEKAIIYVNSKKEGDFENVVLGYSLGGLTAKYCLSAMEKKAVEGKGLHHHTRLYVSYEGEHQGANTMLAVQHFVDNLDYQTWSNILAAGANYLANDMFGTRLHNSPAAKQMSIYHSSQTGYKKGQKTIRNPGQGHHPLRTQFLADLKAQNHRYVKHKSLIGYPNLTRNIGVANGSRSGRRNNSLGLRNGSKVYDKKTGAGKWGLVSSHIKMYSSNPSGDNTVYFHALKTRGLFGFTVNKRIYSTRNPLALDSSPGGYEHTFNYAQGLLAVLQGFSVPKSIGHETFTPIVSVFDIKVWDKPEDMDLFYDVGALMKRPDGTHKDYGYPHLAHSNHYDYTPFDALCATKTNDFHVKKEEPIIAEFLLEEMAPAHLKLQNRTINLGTKSYNADFQAKKISVGKSVTHTTSEKDFVVLSGSDVEMFAETTVDFMPGVDIKSGAKLTVSVDVPMKEYEIKFPSSNNNNSSSSDGPPGITYLPNTDLPPPPAPPLTNPEEIFTIDVPLVTLEVIPNPTSGEFQLMGVDKQAGEIRVLDLSNNVLQKITFSDSGENVNLNISDLDKGSYLVEVKYADGTILTRRITKQ